MPAHQTRGHSGTHPVDVAGNLVGDGLLRVGALMALPGLLGEFGVDADRLLADFGLSSAHFEDPENRIAFATMGRLLVACAGATGCPHFGLLVGERGDASVLGRVGFLLQSSPDVRSALTALSAHYRVHNPNAAVGFVERDEYVAMSYRILPAGIDGREHILDGALAIMFNLLRRLCGPTWLPAQVRFARPRPHDVAPYRRIFCSTVHFDEYETAILFIRNWLDRTPPTADALLHRMMQRQVDDLEVHLHEGIASKVRELLPMLVFEERYSIAAMGQLLHMTPRTLNRRLAEEHTTFAGLLEETRQTMACQLLESTQAPAFQISDSLGYANPSAFTRAFRRWTGSGPAQWRASKRS